MRSSCWVYDLSLTLGTFADFAEELIGVKAGVMAVVPEDLNGVAADGIKLVRLNGVGDGAGGDAFLTGPFVDAIGTGASLPQHLDVIHGAMTVHPVDAQDFGIDLVDFLRQEISLVFLHTIAHVFI